MKSIFVLASMLGIASIGMAQNSDTPSKQGKEERITIIKKNNGDQQKLTIIIDGDKVTVNGEPLENFQDSGIQIIKGQTNGDMSLSPGRERRELFISPNREGGAKMFGEGFPVGGNKAFLGVATIKDEKGAKVNEVTKESPADKAGLQKNDVIIKVGDAKIADANDLYNEIGKYNPEDKVTITYLRDGKGNTITVMLDKNKQARDFSMFGNRNFNFKMPNLPGPGREGFDLFRPAKPAMGIKIQNLENGNGLKILDVNEASPAAKAGLKKDDIIIAMDGKELKDVDELRSKLNDRKDGDSFDIKYKRGDKILSTEVKFPKKIKTADL
jgi:serine protease Do